jgi:hypothetical protein
MTLTVYGVLTDRLGHLERISTRMEGQCAVERRAYEAIPSCEYLPAQPPHIGVNVEHRAKELGQVVYLERDRRDSIWAVAVVSGCDSLLAPSHPPMFFSPELRWRADVRDVMINGLALVEQPATVGLAPVVVLASDVREGAWSSRSHNRIAHVELLRRASAAHQHRKVGAPIVVEDPHAASRSTQLAPGVWLDNHGDRIPAEQRGGRYVLDDAGRPVGPVEHFPGGKILSVR